MVIQRPALLASICLGTLLISGCGSDGPPNSMNHAYTPPTAEDVAKAKSVKKQASEEVAADRDAVYNKLRQQAGVASQAPPPGQPSQSTATHPPGKP